MDATVRAGSGRAATRGIGVALATVLAAALASAHAFVARSEPQPNATIVESPARIRIWFDGPIEPLFASIHVENRDKRRVDRDDARVSPSDSRLLEVGLPPLPRGRYRVLWSVIARDGHPREGDFSFLLR
jgi:methionine-rich copper-binding protein CopC